VALYHPLAMSVRQGWFKGLALAAAAVGCLAGMPARALASDTEQSILMDDNRLIYTSPDSVEQNLEQIAALGFDRVKVSVVWSLVAPSPNSAHKPDFDATDPNAYPADAWTRYDLVDQLAHRLGLGVYFQLTAPAPRWAIVPGASHHDHDWSHEPNAREFGEFAEAVGRRYSGTFVPPTATAAPTPVISLPLGVSISGQQQPSGFPSSQPLPAVTWWGIWNEPNFHAWLSPQVHYFHGRLHDFSPYMDRRLTDAGYAGLVASGHAHDTILIAEIASGGTVRPLRFVRDLYCLDSGYRPLRGLAAVALGCPTSGSRAAFVAAHPALFHATGFAHHPYSFDHAPNTPFAGNPTVITLANLGQLERTLDRSLQAYGRPGGMPFYLTEWGYKTDPPNPFSHTTLTEQADWLNEGEYMTWQDPRIRALAQFLLYDDTPRQGAIPGTLSYWSTFQSGLYYHDGRPKPALTAFRIPIWLPRAVHGPRVTVWGQVRPAVHTELQYAVLEYRSSTRAAWSTLAELQTGNPEGYLVTHVRIPARGMVRLDWLDPATGAVEYSRTVVVH
jgi:hypothetical protein